MYYLKSRYYNPEWGRFINADGIIGQTGELLGHNLFAYCKNNSINKFDEYGFRTTDNLSNGGDIGGGGAVELWGLYQLAKLGVEKIEQAATNASEEIKPALAKVGDCFGKIGTLVDNPGIKVNWGEWANHGLERMYERIVTTDQVNAWVQGGKALMQNGGQKYLFITREGAAAVDKLGKLITVYSKYDYDEKMELLVKKLFGN